MYKRQTDPNEQLQKEINQYEQQMDELENKFSLLTSELITPIQMRQALIKLLRLQEGVNLLSFQVLPVTALFSSKSNADDKNSSTLNESSLHLYKHGIKIKLQGQYFQLRDYLIQLENLNWKFFWKDFNYRSKEYPLSELEISIYSLSTSEEFIGV